MTTRKVIQIAATGENENAYAEVIALCDDGTIWLLANTKNISKEKWFKLPAIPQDKEDMK